MAASSSPTQSPSRGSTGGHDEHYGEVANSYHSDENIFYRQGSDLEKWQVRVVLGSLGLLPSHLLVDIGGGTGYFGGLLHSAAGLERKVLCVEPSEGMLSKIDAGGPVQPVQMNALDFIEGTEHPIDRVLLKEVIHHFDAAPQHPTGLTRLMQGLFSKMAAGGKLAICSRPHKSNYPWFPGAEEAWRDGQPDADVFVRALEAAGFTAEVKTHDFAGFSVAKERWLQAVRNRFWSNLSRDYHTDAELDQGIRYMETNCSDPVVFTEQYLVITGLKP